MTLFPSDLTGAKLLARVNHFSPRGINAAPAPIPAYDPVGPRCRPTDLGCCYRVLSSLPLLFLWFGLGCRCCYLLLWSFVVGGGGGGGGVDVLVPDHLLPLPSLSVRPRAPSVSVASLLMWLLCGASAFPVEVAVAAVWLLLFSLLTNCCGCRRRCQLVVVVVGINR